MIIYYICFIFLKIKTVSFDIIGIQLKQKGETAPFALFPYCPGPMTEGPARVEWKIITQEPIVSQHILCHQLKDGDNIPELITKCSSEFTAGLILVNVDDAYVVSRKFQWDGMEGPSFPVCILTAEDGQKLLGMVEQQEMGELLVRVESRSVTEAEAKRGKSPSPEELSLTLEMAKSIIELSYFLIIIINSLSVLLLGKKNIRRPFHRPRIDLKKRIKEILTPNPSNPPVCVSENQELFQKLMDEFLNYENAVSLPSK